MTADRQTASARTPSASTPPPTPELNERMLAVIEHRATRLAEVFHLSEDDLDDARQEITLAILRAMRRYKPALASPETFADRVATKQYIKLAIRIKRDREREATPDTDAVNASVDPTSEGRNPIDTKLDLEAALATLPRHLRLIAEDLKTKKPGEIAAAMGVHRSTVHRAIVQIRAHLVACGVGIFED